MEKQPQGKTILVTIITQYKKLLALGSVTFYRSLPTETYCLLMSSLRGIVGSPLGFETGA